MKVICIRHDTATARGPEIVPIGSIKEGHIYTVINTTEFKNDVYYLLQEQQIAWYNSHLFVPISDIDETTFERNYNKELQPK